MSDAVARVIGEREALDSGFAGSVAVSFVVHSLVLAVAWLAPFLLLRQRPPLQVADGFVVALPPGGGGSPNAAPAAPPQPAPQVEPPAPEPAAPEPAAPEPPPKIVKPPQEEARKGLPEPDAKTRKARKPKERPASTTRPPALPTAAPSRAGGAAGVGRDAGPLGIGIGPVGPGVPGGTDPAGDWYLAGVQRKIWMNWSQQIRTGLASPIRVSFTILADGGVEDVRVLDPSPVAMLNLAAQRAIVSAAPFGPLPRSYGTNRYTIQAIFKPTD